MLNFLFCMVIFVIGIFIGCTSVVLKVPVNATTEAFAMCGANGDLDRIEVKTEETRAICANGAVFKLKE